MARRKAQYQARTGGGQGQKPAACLKYRNAVAACDSAEHVGESISQIAQRFELSPTGLGSRLRVHHPEILERRERERQRLGLADNRHRGARKWAQEQYAEAIELPDGADSQGCFQPLPFLLFFYSIQEVLSRSEGGDRVGGNNHRRILRNVPCDFFRPFLNNERPESP